MGGDQIRHRGRVADPQPLNPALSSRLGYGLVVKEYGAGREANSEYFARMRGIFDREKVRWQTHAYDAGYGGSTIAAWFAGQNMEVMDVGVGLLGMHSPFDIFLHGAAGSLAAGMCTGLGALGIFLVRRLNPRIEDGLLSAAAGVMLAATFFSLLLPALDRADALTPSRFLAVSMVGAGLALGAIGLFCVHRLVPHEHFLMGKEGPDSTRLKRIWLFIIAITLHNFPEGMAVGVGFAGGDEGNGLSLAIGIGLQNIPEGFAVAISLLSIGYSRAMAFWVGMLTGLVEPVGGVVGAAAVTLAEPLMPAILGLAAGAMLFVISDEIIPETHRRGYESVATFSLLGGFVAMMYLDVIFG